MTDKTVPNPALSLKATQLQAAYAQQVADEPKATTLVRMPEGRFPSRMDGAEAGIVENGIEIYIR